jgi:microfibrillar-associated protein 1
MPPKHMTANPQRGPRHRAGKPIGFEAHSSSSESDSESSEEAELKKPRPSKPTSTAPPKATSFKKPDASFVTAGVKKVDINASAKPSVDDDEFETEESDEGSEEEESESEEDSEEESSSEEDRPKLLRPVVMRKGQNGAASSTTEPSKTDRKADMEADALREEREAERRKAEARDLIQAQIERRTLARAAGKKDWDDDDALDADTAVDDTDGVDPDSEYLAWKLRELMRIKRDRAKIEEAEAEIAEKERRRNLTAAEREEEDRIRLEQQKQEEEEKGGKGQAKFMQKYFHKGAFFTDELAAKGLDERRYMGAHFEDETNKEVLPEYMRIRDMTKLGKKGRTRYRDLKSEDTGRWGQFGDSRRREGPRDDSSYRGDDDRFKPDRFREGDRGREGTGANASKLGERKRYGDERRHRSRSRSWSMERERETKRPRFEDR